MSSAKILSAALLTLFCAARSDAQTIYKCTDDGKVSYGATPCASGKSVALEAPAAPEPDNGASLARLKVSADRLGRERHKREAAEEREQERASRASAAYRRKCGALKLNTEWAAEDAAGASGKMADKARLKARRAAQKLALECPD